MVNMLPFPAVGLNASRTWEIIIRDLKVDCLIGIHDYEKTKRQPVLINLTCQALMPTPNDNPDLNHYLCYDQLIKSIQTLAASDHIHLVETLAERIADYCLADERVSRVTVRVEKTTVYANVGSVGVEIIRERN